MNTESEGNTWYDKILCKLETIFAEVENFDFQGQVLSDPAELDSVRDDQEKLAQDHCSDTFDMNHQAGLRRCKSTSDITLDHKFEEQLEGFSLKDKLSDEKMLYSSALLQDHSDCNQKEATSLCGDHPISSQGSQCSSKSCNDETSSVISMDDSNQREATSLCRDQPISSQGSQCSSKRCNDETSSGISTDDSKQKEATSLCRNRPISSQGSQCSSKRCNHETSSGISTDDSNQIPLATEIQAASVQDIRSLTSYSLKDNQDEFLIKDTDTTPLDFREDPSDFNDKLIYAADYRIKQLRSFKRKIMDALTSKKRREKEYEHLAIWFGDAEMSCDLINTKDNATTSLDSKSSQSNLTFASEDSEWELV